MAQHWSRSFQHLSKSSQASHHIQPSYGTKHACSSQDHVEASDDEHSLVSAGDAHRRADTLQQDGPRKRQKLGDYKDKFVSQKKWKFSDIQPWVPSKPSTKAKNASGSIKTTKSEPLSPEPMSQIDSTSKLSKNGVRTQQNLATSGHAAKHLQVRLQARNSPNPTAPQSQSLHQLERKSPPAPGVPMDSRLQPVSKALAIPLVYDMNTQLSQREITSAGAVHPGTQNTPAVLLKSSLLTAKIKLSANSNTLSLEKDADRIAALIAEKRRENESSMFRERMLQWRQRQHEPHSNEKDYGEDIEIRSVYGLEHQHVRNDYNNTNEAALRIGKDSLYDAAHASTSNNEDVDRNSASEGSGPPTCNEFRKAGFETSKYQIIQADFGNSTTNASLPSLTSAKLPSIQDEHEILFGRSRIKSLPATSDPKQLCGLASATTSSVPENTRAATGMGGVGIVSKTPAWSPRILSKTYPTNSKSYHWGSHEQHGYQYRGRQTRTMPLAALSQNLQRTTSTPSAVTTHLTDLPSGSPPSSQNFSSSQPASKPTPKHTTYADRSAISHTVPSYSSSIGQTRPTSVRDGCVNVIGFYGTSGHVALPTDRRNEQFRPLHQAVRVLTPLTQNSRTHTSPTKQVRTFHPDSADSRVTTSNNKSRPTSDRTVKPPPPVRERVNMFGNTKGTVFPMHEVIRQIEMT